MLYKPKFKPHYHVRIIEPDTVYLLSDKGQCILNNRLYVLLALLLDGNHTVNEIIWQLKKEVPLLDIQQALIRLEIEGYLTESSNIIPQQVAAFWSSLGVEPEIAVQKLQESRISVTALGTLGIESIAYALESLDIQLGEGDFTVVFTDDYLQIGLDAFNREAEETGKPWLLAKPVGTAIWIGPLFIPGETGCWECLAQSLRNNKVQNTSNLHAVLPTSVQLGLNLIAIEIAKWIIWGQHQQLTGTLLAFDLISLSIQEHILVKRSQCPVCGTPES
ncbi:MAG: TOMM precursor leader peptide-binding protein [Scytonema sp. PMC 1069.18]|nr:TOMM precursor leader peptide-binding protein [Scytonema sp. PMC 1069.18]MEC4887077.1 TOMM precursor leader peptide-binding protein [Scytonema sp. PMC 1070.18]